MLHRMLGAELNFHALEEKELYPSLSAPRTYQNNEHRESEAMVMIVPEGSVMLSVVRQGDTMYIQNRCTGALQWHISALLDSSLFPDDSIVHALLYVDRFQNHVLGLFDVTRLNSRALHGEGVLQRHMKLRECMQEHSIHELQVRFLWVGYEKHCVSALMNRDTISGLNFNVKCIGRLPDVPGTDAFQRMLPPLIITH